jgi:ATP-binding cassette subfamily B protein RaxB
MLAGVASASAFLKFGVSWLLRDRITGAQEHEFRSRTNYAIQLTSSLRSLRSLQVYAGVSRALEKIEIAQRKSVESKYTHAALRGAQSATNSAIDVIDRVIFLAIGAWLIDQKMISPGSFLAIALYRESMIAALDGLRSVYDSVRAMRSVGLRLEHLIPSQADDEPSVDVMEQDSRAGIRDGSVVVQDLSFQYGRYGKEIFSRCSFSIKDGEHVAVIGPSGYGKSTLTKLLCGAIVPTSGSIVVGDVDLASNKGVLALRGIGVLMQDDRVFPGSIRENIDMFRQHSQDAIEAAAKLAALHEFILELPMRYDTPVDDDTMHLSGGQRQRLLLARALCGDIKVLIMDEATSHLDAETESRILAAIRKLAITRIMFTHRADAMRAADRVIDLRAIAHTTAIAA